MIREGIGERRRWHWVKEEKKGKEGVSAFLLPPPKKKKEKKIRSMAGDTNVTRF